jgi:hypothetical protein
LFTFAQQKNKPSALPEFSDCSNGVVDGYLLTHAVNFMASSVQGLPNTGIIMPVYNGNPGGGGCSFDRDPLLQAAISQPWPNGWDNTYYNGTYFLQQGTGALIPR